jgi:hypothetical protein
MASQHFKKIGYRVFTVPKVEYRACGALLLFTHCDITQSQGCPCHFRGCVSDRDETLFRFN